MTPQEMDAFIQVIREAIDKRFEDFEREQKRGLIQMAKNAMRTDAELWARALDEKLKRMVGELPKPQDGEDGKDATPEQIAQAVNAYMEAHPVLPPAPLAPTPEQISEAVSKHMAENPIVIPDPLAPTAEQVQEAVTKHFEAKPVEVKTEMVAEEVEKYIKANPPKNGKDGDRGLDAIQIEILPQLNTSKRYPKGTYARYKGGVVRSYRDTDIGNDALACGWEVVMNGVDEVQVHQLEVGQFAIKSILTNGQSHIVKVTLPAMEYKKVWNEGQEYVKGSVVTQNGSMWHCNRPTTDKPGTSDAWTLCVKKGSDGKDLNVVKKKPDVYHLDPKKNGGEK